MANQPNPPASAASRLPSRNNIGWLLLGMFIGLLIGWIAWPVGWTDAGLDDLHPEVRAQFISATADAYVASGGQDPSTALARMQAFADPQAAVFEAIAFYQNSGDPNRGIREVNLRSLASALGASSPPTEETTAASQEIGLVDWILGITTALLLLGGGLWIGSRLLAQWRAAQQESEPDTYPSSGMPYPAPTPAQPAQPVSGWQPVAPADQSPRVPGGQRTTRSRVVVETWDNEDPASSPTAPGIPSAGRDTRQPSTQFPPQTPAPAQAQPRRDDADTIQRITPAPAPLSRFALDEEDEEFVEADDETDGDEFDGIEFNLAGPKAIEAKEAEWSAWKFEEAPTPAGTPATVPDEDDDGGWENDWTEDNAAEDDEIGLDEDIEDDLDEEVDEEEEWFPPLARVPAIPATPETKERPAIPPGPILDIGEEEEEGSKFLPTVQGVLSSFLRGEKESSSPAKASKEIAVFMAEFHAGILAYEQSFTITSTGGEDGAPLGACGAGISERLDKEAAHSDKVRVLDIWLYDGTEVRSYNQFLTTPGMDREALAGQAPSSGTITGEPLEIAPGLTFRIASRNLILDCRVVTAELLNSDTPPSPLRVARIEMTARAAK